MAGRLLSSVKAPLVRVRLPLSSRKLLMAALFALVGLMGAALLYASRVLEAVSAETLAHAARSLALADDVRMLQDLTVSMERSARQFAIVGDPQLARDVDHALMNGKQLARRLGPLLPPQEQLLVARWSMLADSAVALLRQGPSATDAQRQRMLALFGELGAVNRQIENGSRLAIDRSAESFERDMGRHRQNLLAVGSWVAALSIAAALMLGLWLSWLFDELSAAIANLGEPREPARPPIGGPTDVHLLALHIAGVKQTLQALEKDKELFMRHISHELKTPLANLREGIALMEDRVAGRLSRQQQEIVAILSANADALHRQIDDLLQYNTAVFAAGRLALAPVDLVALIRSAIAEQRLRCDARGLQVEVVGTAAPAPLDAGKMRVVVDNLLANAIHFSPDGGRIRFLVGQAGARLQVDCIDEGCGVAPEDRERIFDPFYQGRRQVPAARKGTGIGLSIVRQLVDAHGGSVRALDHDGGARFRMDLPCAT